MAFRNSREYFIDHIIFIREFFSFSPSPYITLLGDAAWPRDESLGSVGFVVLANFKFIIIVSFITSSAKSRLQTKALPMHMVLRRYCERNL